MSEVKKARLSLILTILLCVLIGPHLSGSFSAYHARPIPFQGKIINCKTEVVNTGRNQTAQSVVISMDKKTYEYRLPFRGDYNGVSYKSLNRLREHCKNNSHLSGSYIVAPTGIWNSSNRIFHLSDFSDELNARLKKYFKGSLEYFFVVLLIIFIIINIVYTTLKSFNIKINYKSSGYVVSGRKKEKKNRKSLKLKRKAKRSN
jgi:hypothetical protein